MIEADHRDADTDRHSPPRLLTPDHLDRYPDYEAYIASKASLFRCQEAGDLKVLNAEGVWVRPVCLAILDDRSRLVCHVQWYLSETAEDLVHGLSQAFQKRGLPRAQLTDNGSAMLAEEVKAGLLRLGIIHETTLPYSPYQNGKQEVFWAVLEGRLMSMLEGVKDLTMALLNEATQAWVELEYNRALHSETGEKPLDRFLQGPDVLRPCPSSETLRDHFRQEIAVG